MIMVGCGTSVSVFTPLLVTGRFIHERIDGAGKVIEFRNVEGYPPSLFFSTKKQIKALLLILCAWVILLVSRESKRSAAVMSPARSVGTLVVLVTLQLCTGKLTH